MTNEMLVILAQNGHKASKLALWDNMQGLFYKKAAAYYLANTEKCISHGVELDDLKQVCYFAFLDAVKNFKPESGFMFSTFINYPFQNAVNALLGLRTSRQQNEPLNNCRSLDKPLENADGDVSTLLDLVQDETSLDFMDALDRDEEAAFIRQVVEDLKEPYRTVIQRYYFQGESMQEIAEPLGITPERVRQYKYKALRILRQNGQLRRMYREQCAHNAWICAERWEYSPERYALVQQLRERNLSYGYQQAAIYAARERWIRMQEQGSNEQVTACFSSRS